MKTPVVVEENGKKFTLYVPKGCPVEKVRIDGGVIVSNELRKCDWAIKVNPQEFQHLYYVELKGCDLMHAISQLERTITELFDENKNFKNRNAHAVCSRVIPAVLSSAQVKAVKFKKTYGFLLKWHSQHGRAECI